MNAKRYLEQIRYLDIKIANKVAERNALLDLAVKVTPTLSSDIGRSGGASDKVGNCVVKLVDMEKEIDMAIDNFVDTKRRIISEIEELKDPRYYEILHKRYVQYKNLYDISDEMGYNYDVVRRMHGKALLVFGRLKNL